MQEQKAFTWTVENHGDFVITMVRFRHFRGRQPICPKGWSEAAMTGNEERLGQKLETGIIEFKADSISAGIRDGGSAVFSLRLDSIWHGDAVKDTVVVGLADGTELTVPGVLRPARESFFSRNATPLGLGAMFAAYVVYKLWRGRRTPSRTGQSAGASRETADEPTLP